MWTKSSIAIIAICVTGFAAVAVSEEYPAPRSPKLPEVRTVDDLMPIARSVVRGPARRAFATEARYGVKAGEKVMMVVSNTFSPLVRDALAKAIRDEGARLDVVILDSRTRPQGHEREGLPQDGTAEAARMLDPPKFEPGEKKMVALTKADRYDLMVEGTGGPKPVSTFRWEHIPYDTVEKFVVTAGFPAEVQDLLNEKAWNLMAQARRVHVTDPEGTDITWSVSPEGFDKARKEWDKPVFPKGTYDIVIRGHISLSPLFVAGALDARGVVAGTINHTGVFPHVSLYIDSGQVKRAEGGGSYGETISALIKKYAEVQYPGFPGKGVGWFIESAMGTNPKVSRVTTAIQGEGMSWERGRSGVIHWGFGVSIAPGASNEEAYEKKVAAENLTMGHFHVHTYFSTVDLETADGKTARLVDKGRLTALDDPEVRKVAAKYGDPDELLKEAWIPAIPGINAPGTYKDYAANPAMYVKKDVESITRPK